MTETPGETPVERRLAQFHDHIVKGLERRPDDRVTAYCSQPDVDALAAGFEAIALLREIETVTFEQWEAKRRALLARCEGDR